MFRFHLGRIPVVIHPSHLLVSALFGTTFVSEASRQPAATGRLFAALAEGSGPRYMLAAVAMVALWMAIVFVSVLVHELGHALSALAFGGRPVVQLVWLGGHTRPNTPGRLPWHRNVL